MVLTICEAVYYACMSYTSITVNLDYCSLYVIKQWRRSCTMPRLLYVQHAASSAAVEHVFCQLYEHTHPHTYTHCDKVIAISESPYYVVGVDNNPGYFVDRFKGTRSHIIMCMKCQRTQYPLRYSSTPTTYR